MESLAEGRRGKVSLYDMACKKNFHERKAYLESLDWSSIDLTSEENLRALAKFVENGDDVNEILRDHSEILAVEGRSLFSLALSSLQEGANRKDKRRRARSSVAVYCLASNPRTIASLDDIKLLARNCCLGSLHQIVAREATATAAASSSVLARFSAKTKPTRPQSVALFQEILEEMSIDYTSLAMLALAGVEPHDAQMSKTNLAESDRQLLKDLYAVGSRLLRQEKSSVALGGEHLDLMGPGLIEELREYYDSNEKVGKNIFGRNKVTSDKRTQEVANLTFTITTWLEARAKELQDERAVGVVSYDIEALDLELHTAPTVDKSPGGRLVKETPWDSSTRKTIQWQKSRTKGKAAKAVGGAGMAAKSDEGSDDDSFAPDQPRFAKPVGYRVVGELRGYKSSASRLMKSASKRQTRLFEDDSAAEDMSDDDKVEVVLDRPSKILAEARSVYGLFRRKVIGGIEYCYAGNPKDGELYLAAMDGGIRLYKQARHSSSGKMALNLINSPLEVDECLSMIEMDLVREELDLVKNKLREFRKDLGEHIREILPEMEIAGLTHENLKQAKEMALTRYRNKDRQAVAVSMLEIIACNMETKVGDIFPSRAQQLRLYAVSLEQPLNSAVVIQDVDSHSRPRPRVGLTRSNSDSALVKLDSPTHALQIV